jgi:threonine/homoserine/homoserine lactone efflux protein
MIDTAVLLKYVTIGFAVAAPVGPMSLLCIDRTLRKGFIAGAVFGGGIAIADITYAFIVGIGLASVQNWLSSYGNWLRIGGAVIIAILAIPMWRRHSIDTPRREVPNAHWRAAVVAYTLTMSNPHTILLFATVLAATSLSLDTKQAGIFAAGVGIGSFSWWLILTASMQRIAHRLSPDAITAINRLMASILLGIAVYLIVSALQ